MLVPVPVQMCNVHDVLVSSATKLRVQLQGPIANSDGNAFCIPICLAGHGRAEVDLSIELVNYIVNS